DRAGFPLTWLATGQGWQEGDTLRLEYSRNGGTSWTTAAGAENLPYQSGSHTLDITSLPSGSNYLFRIASNRVSAVYAAIQGAVTVHNSGATYYVNDALTPDDVRCTAAGNDANDGHSPGSPKASVQALLDTCNLEFGDQVLIDSGTYAVTTNIVVGADDGGSILGYVTLKGVPGRTIIDRQSTSTGAAGILVRGDYVRVEGLTVRNGRYGIALDTDLAKYAVVQGNVVMNNLTAGVDVRSWASSSVDGKHYVIANNLAVNNGTGLFLQGGWNPSFSTAEFQVVNNTVAGSGNGIYAASSEDGKGYVTLTNNIVSISGAGRYAIGDAASSVAASDYNLFWLSGGAIVAQRTESLYTKNYTTLASWQARTGKDGHSLNTDPFFANAAAGDYHLRSKGGRYEPGSGSWVVDTETSWAIDTGDPAAATGSEATPHGGRVNMGAYGGTAEASKTPPGRSLRVLSPNAGEAVAGSVRLQWNSQGTGWETGDDSVKLEYSSDAGGTWRAVEGAGSVQHWLGQAKWTTAGLTPDSGSAFLWRLTSNADAQVFDVSDRVFTLHNQPLSYYVNDSATAGDKFCFAAGANANNGTSPAAPKETVQALLDFYDLEPGDTVYIDSGTYLLTSNIEVSATDGGGAAGYMSFKGVPGSTVIDRQSTATDAIGLRIAGNYVNVEGLTLRNGRDGIGFEDYSAS
ncbi:MAG TPA: NosD domain-containing protein, partial [Prosthecobacter sp.]|nr:NosD domain-containing protein [Prosthecobacter sp.]